jgi:alpha-L-fucosidase
MLVNIVSKNGNLLLSIPLRGDGTIDDQERRFLEGLAAWMVVNGEGIFATRPWHIYGEGPTRGAGGMFSEGRDNYTAQDIRFTTKNGNLYVFVLGVPKEPVTVKSLGLAAEFAKPIATVKLLGSDEVVQWNQADDALAISPPAKPPTDHAIAFRVTFK